jgi:hypothetical protein
MTQNLNRSDDADDGAASDGYGRSSESTADRSADVGMMI